MSNTVHKVKCVRRKVIEALSRNKTKLVLFVSLEGLWSLRLFLKFRPLLTLGEEGFFQHMEELNISLSNAEHTILCISIGVLLLAPLLTERNKESRVYVVGAFFLVPFHSFALMLQLMNGALIDWFIFAIMSLCAFYVWVAVQGISTALRWLRDRTGG